MPIHPGHLDFQVIHDSLLRDLAERGRVTTFDKGNMLIREGDRGDTMLVILAGRVKVFSSNSEGKEVIYNIYGVGETIGEMALDHGTRSASVQAMEETICSVINHDELRRYISANPDFAMHLVAMLIGRTRTAVESLRQMALLDVHGRLVNLLTSLTPEHKGVGKVTERLSQQELADRVGASRDMVSRILLNLEEEGYVEIRSRQIDVLKPLPKE